MPGGSLTSDGPRDELSLTFIDKLTKACGRKRYCKKCSFTCTDSREFMTHHATHTDSDDVDDRSFPPNSGIVKLGFRKPARSKCKLKSSFVDKVAIMEPKVGSITESISVAEHCVYKVATPSNNTMISNNTEKCEEFDQDSLKSSLDRKQTLNHLSSELMSGDLRSSELMSGDLRSSELMSGDLRSSELMSINHLSVEQKSSELLSGDLRSSELLSGDLRSSELLSGDLRSSEHSTHERISGQNISSLTDESLNVNKKIDELDAVISTTAQNNINSTLNRLDNKALPNYIIENFSSSDDEDDDNEKLVVDDGSTGKLPARPRCVRNRTYSCHHCDMATTSARSYAHHLKNEHGIQFSIYECDLCDYATVYKHKLPLHRKLHFTPEQQEELPCYSADKSLIDNNKNNSYSSKHDLFKDEVDEDEDDCDTPSGDLTSTSPTPLTVTSENIDKVLDEDKKQKKKTRQEVDPGKYFEAVDSGGTKYACSQCGNIYKWRKSLNKHWKEKHTTEDLAELSSPPGMVEVLKSGKYTQLGSRRIYDKTFLSTIKTSKSDDVCITASVNGSIQSPSPPSIQNTTKYYPGTNSSLASAGVALTPSMIGPFVSSTAQPVFPGMPMMLHHIPLHDNGVHEESALDLSHESKPAPRISPFPSYLASSHEHNSSPDQCEPLDFSKPSKKSTGKATPEISDSNNHKPTHSNNQILLPADNCSKCDFPCTCPVELSTHSNTHLSKRIFKCFDCKLQISSMEELNSHFLKLHFQKLSEHKEAIKRIPHGLQQAYHVLNMNIQDIGELGSQDLGTAEGKSLKCKKCNFEAKWPAELQKHAVSHSEERPYVCMVCGSTYKWKWDLVKHFQKSHPDLPNPYRRNDKKESPDESSEDDGEPSIKRQKLCVDTYMNGIHQYGQDDVISVEGIIAATKAGQMLISNQPNILDNESTLQRSLAFFNRFPFTPTVDVSVAAEVSHGLDGYRAATHKLQGPVRSQHNSVSGSTGSSSGKTTTSSSSSPGATKPEELSYKCTMCNYHARWPSEVTQHMKNHSDCKPYLCPRCEYRSKWKWDVVKHLKRCGGGTIKDVIDTTKPKRVDVSGNTGHPTATLSAPVVSKYGKVKKASSQKPHSYATAAIDESNHSAMDMSQTGSSSGNELSRPTSRSLMQDLNCSITNNNDSTATDNNVNNKYTNGPPFSNVNPHILTASNIFSAIGNISASSPSYPSKSSVPQTSSSRHSSSIWNCPHCPFTTQSQAELKRHSDLHSDDKPFKCNVCQYSTRWACDLKKHRKGYNHYPTITNTNEAANKTEKTLPRFKCSQCAIYFETFDNLLQHRLAEHVGHPISSQSDTSAVTENGIDMARIKHPRKQIKQFQCPKCPFICKNRQTMVEHVNEHEQLELLGVNCFYCDSSFKDKESLLDHITTHSAFNPKEWETFFMISEEERHLSKSEKLLIPKKDVDKPQHHGTNKTKSSSNSIHEVKDENNSTCDSTEARIKQILNEIPKEMTAPQKVALSTQFKCEWCPVEFVNLTSLYKHATQVHPSQLKEQDPGMDIDDEHCHPKMQPDQLNSVKSLSTGDAIDILKQQVKEKRKHQMAEKHMDRSMSKIEKNQNRKLNEKHPGNHKSNYSSTNSTMFQNHYELHGRSHPSQCWFCDFTVDQMNLLYQHMKISHTRKWKTLSQNPKYASHIHKINLAFSHNGVHVKSIDNLSGNSQNGVDLSLKSETTTSEMTHDIMFTTRQQCTWSEIPVNIVPIDNALAFVCPHCAFQSPSVTNTCNHVTQSHRAMLKFTCKKCQYSDDNIHKISDHCTKEHAPTERVVEIVDFKQINLTELQLVQLNAYKEQVTIDFSKNNSRTDLKSSAMKPLCCPFCPFRTLITEHMKVHVSSHSGQGSYQCHVCDYSSDVSSVVIDHVIVHEADYEIDTRSLSVMKTEVKSELMDSKTYEPESKPTAGIQEIMGLMEEDHSEDTYRSKMGKRIRYRCSVCPYHSTCRSNMVKHARQHNNNKKYKCSKCSYGAARAVLLKNHIDSHETSVEGEGHHYDIFFDPNSPSNDDIETGETEMDDDDSDDIDEMDAKAIADLEAKDILLAESALKASTILENGDITDKSGRRQKCPRCPFSSMSESELRKHLSYHGTQQRYKCDHCSYSLDRLNLLSQHRRLHDHEPGYVPNPPATDLLNTNFIFKQNVELAKTGDFVESTGPEETIKQTSVSELSCKLCPYKTSKKRPFEIHCSNHRSRKFYICDFCDWSTDRIGHLRQHRTVHENEPMYNPELEDKIFLNQEFHDAAAGEFEAKFMEVKNLDRPVDESQRGLHMSPPFKLTVVKKIYPCKQCPFKSSSKNSYYVHKSMHKSGSDFACSKCSYASMNRGLLQQHLYLHTSDADNPFPVRDTLNKHEGQDLEAANEIQETSLLNSVNKFQDVDSSVSSELKCQRCPFTASSHSALIDHNKGHASQESLMCPYCDFSATSRQVMFPHIQIHFPGTNVELDALEHMMEEHARKMFSSNHNFNNSHTNNNNNNPDKLKSFSPKPEKLPGGEESAMKRVYVCQFCEREFEAKQLMIQHEKQHLVGNQ